jgi:spermidine synthase
MPDANRPSATERVARGLPILVAVSGGAALVYQSLWMRSFGLIFGNTTDAVAMVLAVFMGGLALGSALAARRRSPDPLRAYALVELGIGGAALLTLPLLRAVPWAYGAFAGRAGLEGPVEMAGRMALAAIVLLPATVMLGMTVPFAVETLARAGRPVHASFGRLYLLNTLGGAAGVALAPFLLVPVLGVRGTLVAAAVGSLAVGGLALYWRRGAGPLAEALSKPIAEASAGATSEPPPSPQAPRPRALGPGLAVASGAATFGIEVLWTRSYALVIGSSVYAFNLMLLAVLLGIAGGAAIYGRVRGRIVRPARAVGLLFVAAAFAVLAGQWLIGGLPIVYLAALDLLPVSFVAHQVAGLALCLVTMLPVTLVLGLTFPLLLHLADTDRGSAQEASGRLYAWNTAGAIGGALAADLVLIPRLGLQPPYLVFGALLLGGGVWALTEAASWPPAWRGLTPASLVIALFVVSPRWTPWDPVLMSSGVHRYGLEWRDRIGSAFDLATWLREQQELVFYREGSEAVVAVSKTKAGRHFLSVNGKTDAGSSEEDVVTQRFIAHVPMLLHPAPRRVLVIGWGAGATAASAGLYPLETLECVEIEPAVFEAASYFAELNEAVRNDDRFRMAFRDGRNHLLRDREPWDVIVSEPSNPWISGVSNLFTREFYEVVRGRLAPGGVFGQWFHYYHLDGPDVKVEVNTFLAVFPHASLWLVPPVVAEDGTKTLGADLLLVGSHGPHALDWARVETMLGKTPVGDDLRATRAVGDPLALVASWAMGRREMESWVRDEEAFPSGTPLNTDDHPYIEFVAPRRNVMAPVEAARAASATFADMSLAAGDARDAVQGLLGEDAGANEVAALHRELSRRHLAARQPERALAALDEAVAAFPGDAAARTQAADLLLGQGREEEALARLRVAVRLDPDDLKAWDLLGQIAIDRRDYPLAEAAHRAMLRREPSHVTAWLRLGAVLARQERWGEAREALRWAKQLDPEAPVDPELERYIENKAARAAPPAGS